MSPLPYLLFCQLKIIQDVSKILYQQTHFPRKSRTQQCNENTLNQEWKTLFYSALGWGHDPWLPPHLITLYRNQKVNACALIFVDCYNSHLREYLGGNL